MLTRNKLYERKQPEREAKLILIFCEGEKREFQYFNFFSELNSRLRIEVEPPTEGNDPIKLYESARKKTEKSENNPNPKYDIQQEDEIWFVIDTDTWKEKISELRVACTGLTNRFISQSNPCFEVWLFYHFSDSVPSDKLLVSSKEWKTYLDSVRPGGFDCRKHPVYIEKAIINAGKNYSEINSVISPGSTQVFLLAKKILPLVKKEITEMIAKQKLED